MTRDELEVHLEREHAGAFAWALRCSGGVREEAEDALHAAYERILGGRAVFGGRSTFRTWLFGVIRHAAIEEQRRGRFRLERLRLWFARNGMADPRAEEQDGLIERERAERLIRALGRLSRRQGEMLHLVFYQEMTIAEAAGVLGVPVGTARTHYERGKARLRTLLVREDFK